MAATESHIVVPFSEKRRQTQKIILCSKRSPFSLSCIVVAFSIPTADSHQLRAKWCESLVYRKEVVYYDYWKSDFSLRAVGAPWNPFLLCCKAELLRFWLSWPIERQTPAGEKLRLNSDWSGSDPPRNNVGTEFFVVVKLYTLTSLPPCQSEYWKTKGQQTTSMRHGKGYPKPNLILLSLLTLRFKLSYSLLSWESWQASWRLFNQPHQVPLFLLSLARLVSHLLTCPWYQALLSGTQWNGTCYQSYASTDPGYQNWTCTPNNQSVPSYDLLIRYSGRFVSPKWPFLYCYCRPLGFL